MVQIIQELERGPSLGQKFSNAVGAGIQQAGQLYQQHQEKESISKLLGPESANLPRDFQKLMLEKNYKSASEREKQDAELKQNDAMLRDLEIRRELPPGSLNAYRSDPKAAEQVTRPAKEGKQALTEKEVPSEISKKIKKVLSDNPKASSDDLRVAMDEVGIPPVYSNPYTENRRRTQEQLEKTGEEHRRALRAETLPIRSDLAKKAQAAEKGIQNKEQLLDLIENGDINDPTFAALAEALPLNLGKRLLSNDTVEYKAGLVEEFSDLRNIFQGQTRVKEIELLENKIADIYLNNDQKKAIMKSRINALKADVIRAEAAAALENRDDLGVLQFQKEVDKAAKPQLDALFNQILDEQKSIIQNAENRKQTPLDINDPDDKRIMQEILKEAKGDKNEAKKLAKKKGYIVKGSR